jgi:hypothetical protein
MQSNINPINVDVDIQQINPNTWSILLQEDPDTGELIMPIPDSIMESQGWAIGDTLCWDTKEDGSVVLSKKE